VRKQQFLKPKIYPESMDVNATGISRKVSAHYPGRSACLPNTKNLWSKATDVVRRQEEQAEVSRGHSTVPLAREGLNVE